MTWAQTTSGQAVDFLSPLPSSIRLFDIATMLSRQSRFNGGTKPGRAFSVASHSLLALAACETEDPLARLAVLMHDAHEFVTGDQITPFKQAVMAMVRSNPIETIQVRIQTAIDIAAGMHGAMMRFRAVIKTADLLALAIEKRDLMADEPQSWGVVTPDVRDHALTAIPDSEDGAQTRFITQFHKLASAAAVIPMDTFYMDGGKLP